MWPRAEPAYALLLTALGGWLWGSFLNQLIDRSPHRGAAHADGGPHGAEPPPGVGWLRPSRSLCFACLRPIAWYDNVPVLSWLWLGGRCRACAASIGARTLLVELAAPLLLVSWHALWLALGLAEPVLLWGLVALSWGLVAGGLLAERRRWHAGFLAAGAVLVALAAAGLHW
jgi:leader peptidase (prepilin peptidase) / N-methyltransferase